MIELNKIFNATHSEWEEFINAAQNNILSLTIPIDINPSTAKSFVSKLDEQYGKLKIVHGHLSKKLNQLEKMIYVIEHKNREGKNDTDRKINGIFAVENYETNQLNSEGKKINVNLYNEQIFYYNRFKDIESLIEIINRKMNNIITLNGLMKIEASFA